MRQLLLEHLNMPSWLRVAYLASMKAYISQRGSLSNGKQIPTQKTSEYDWDILDKHITPKQLNKSLNPRTTTLGGGTIARKDVKDYINNYGYESEEDITYFGDATLYAFLNGEPVHETVRNTIQLPAKIYIGKAKFQEIPLDSEIGLDIPRLSKAGARQAKKENQRKNLVNDNIYNDYVRPIYGPHVRITIPNNYDTSRMSVYANGGYDASSNEFIYKEVPKDKVIDVTNDPNKKLAADEIGYEITNINKKGDKTTSKYIIFTKLIPGKFNTNNPGKLEFKEIQYSSLQDYREKTYRNTVFFFHKPYVNSKVKVEIVYWDNNSDMHIINSHIIGKHEFKTVYGQGSDLTDTVTGNVGMHKNKGSIYDIAMLNLDNQENYSDNYRFGRFDKNKSVDFDTSNESLVLDEDKAVYDYSDEVGNIFNNDSNLMQHYNELHDNLIKLALFLKEDKQFPVYQTVEKSLVVVSDYVDEFYDINLRLFNLVKGISKDQRNDRNNINTQLSSTLPASLYCRVQKLCNKVLNKATLAKNKSEPLKIDAFRKIAIEFSKTCRIPDDILKLMNYYTEIGEVPKDVVNLIYKYIKDDEMPDELTSIINTITKK